VADPRAPTSDADPPWPRRRGDLAQAAVGDGERHAAGGPTERALWVGPLHCYAPGVGPSQEVDQLLDALGGERAGDEHLARTYQDLRKLAGFLMAREPPGQTLQATALVNEAYLKLVGGERVEWADRRHLVNTVARAMRQVLVDRARKRGTVKHGGDRRREPLDSLAAAAAETVPPDRIHELERAVAQLERANARWAEVVHLRFFVGLTIEQTAEVMGLSPTAVKSDWTFARAWLGKAMQA